jgi:RimJ/RimL family protein N-acetyltransferase
MLKDGTPVTVRAIRAEDWTGVAAAFKSLDPDSVYTRFFAFKKSLTDTELTAITEVDFVRVVALVMTTPENDRDRLIGGGRYVSGDEPTTARSAELGFTTANDYRGRGVASRLLAHLMLLGREQGLSRFEAEVLAHNRPMLEVFRRSGQPVMETIDAGVIHVMIDLRAVVPSPA